MISVGRLVDYKGHDIAINSLKFLPENYLLKIIGDGKKFKTSGIRLNIWKKDYSYMSDEQLSVVIGLVKESVKVERR